MSFPEFPEWLSSGWITTTVIAITAAGFSLTYYNQILRHRALQTTAAGFWVSATLTTLTVLCGSEQFLPLLPLVGYFGGALVAKWKISHENRVRKDENKDTKKCLVKAERLLLLGFPEPYAWFYLYQDAKDNGATFYLHAEGKETILEGSIVEWPIAPDDAFTIELKGKKRILVPHHRVISIERIPPTTPENPNAQAVQERPIQPSSEEPASTDTPSSEQEVDRQPSRPPESPQPQQT